MLRHYVKVAIRGFRRNKVIFVGSLMTLCLGALCIALLFTYVYNEFTTDDFHKQQEDIYMMVAKMTPQGKTKIIEPSLFFGLDYTAHPEIEHAVNVHRYPKGSLKFEYKKETYTPQGIIAGTSFFNVFDFELKVGDRDSLLSRPDVVVLTEQFAAKLFGKENPIGRTVSVKGSAERDLEVAGIVANPPSYSSIDFDFILPGELAVSFGRMGGEFIVVNKGFDISAFNEKIKTIGHNHPQFDQSELFVEPFAGMYFNEKDIRTMGVFSKSGNRNNLYVLIGVMIVLLVISVLNFSNLQLIKTNDGIFGDAIKRLHGANKGHIYRQKIVEILILTFLAFAILLPVFYLTLPLFNELVGVPLSPSVSFMMLIVFGTLLPTVILGLVYPISVTFKVRPVSGLRKRLFVGNKLGAGKVTVVVQFALTFILLIATVVMTRQLRHMLDKDLGFDTEGIISVSLMNDIPWDSSNERKAKRKADYEYIKNELGNNPNIASFSQGNRPMETYKMDWKRSDGDFKHETQNTVTVSPGYEKVLGLEMIEGRFFSRARDSSRGIEIVINQAAKKFWGIEDIATTKFSNATWGKDGGWRIIGVVEDFSYEHLSTKTEPLFMLYMEDVQSPFLIKLQKGATVSGLAFIEALYKRQHPNEVFNFSFLADDVANLYQEEKQLSINYMLFASIALVISAIGLFSIAMFDTRQRVKEIAVRKVNGAKIGEILMLLNKDFTKWVGLAFIIAVPIAWYALNKWLEGFAHRTDLRWWIFALTGVGTLFLALLTVSWVSYRAAATNPTKSLRTE